METNACFHFSSTWCHSVASQECAGSFLNTRSQRQGEHGAPAAHSGYEAGHRPACELHPGSPKQTFTFSHEPRTSQPAKALSRPPEATAGRVPVPAGSAAPRRCRCPSPALQRGSSPQTGVSPTSDQSPRTTLGAGSSPPVSERGTEGSRCSPNQHVLHAGSTPARRSPQAPPGPAAPHSPRRCGRSQPGPPPSPGPPAAPSAGPLCPVTGATAAGLGLGRALPPGPPSGPRAWLPGNPGWKGEMGAGG